MHAIPKKPETQKLMDIDKLAAQQDKLREAETGVQGKGDTPAAGQVESLPVSGLGTSSSAVVGNGNDEILKQTQFNLPVSLNERIAVVARRYHANNKSHFAREVLEEAVSRLEKLMKKEEENQ